MRDAERRRARELHQPSGPSGFFSACFSCEALRDLVTSRARSRLGVLCVWKCGVGLHGAYSVYLTAHENLIEAYLFVLERGAGWEEVYN